MKRKDVKIKLLYQCECGHTEPLVWDFPDVRFIPAYTNDSGTSWPSELEIKCKGCGGIDLMVEPF